ncbi:MAG: glycerophosphodiester phosphodiesterase [Fibrobacterales bacterium]
MLLCNIAHRGLHAVQPENTLESFLAAWQIGAHMIECDIQLSSDGVPVIFHDDTLQRMCGVDKAVYECTVLELQSYTIGASGAKIPTLQELMNIGADRPHYFELKVPDAKKNDRLYKEELVDKAYHYFYGFKCLEKSYVASFDQELFHIIRSKDLFDENLVITFEFPHEVTAYRESNDQIPYASYQWNGLLKEDHSLLIDSHTSFVWGVDSPSELASIVECGVVGVITDFPENIIE